MWIKRSDIYSLSTGASPRFERQKKTQERQAGERARADVDRHAAAQIHISADHGRDNTHHSITRHGDGVARASVFRRKDLGRVGVENAVVDVQTDADDTAEDEILHGCANARVSEEKEHRQQSTDDHRVPTPEKAHFHQTAGDHRTENTAGVDDGVVAIGGVRRVIAGLRPARLQIIGQKDVVQRIGQTDQRPGENVQHRRSG